MWNKKSKYARSTQIMGSGPRIPGGVAGNIIHGLVLRLLGALVIAALLVVVAMIRR